MKLSPSQQVEFDKLSKLEQEFYVPKAKLGYMNDNDAMEELKELYSDTDFSILVCTDNPLLKFIKDGTGISGLEAWLPRSDPVSKEKYDTLSRLEKEFYSIASAENFFGVCRSKADVAMRKAFRDTLVYGLADSE